jgi:hypothetical protein
MSVMSDRYNPVLAEYQSTADAVFFEFTIEPTWVTYSIMPMLMSRLLHHRLELQYGGNTYINLDPIIFVLIQFSLDNFPTVMFR